jgi:Phospholipase_D-nuclease N-terminal
VNRSKRRWSELSRGKRVGVLAAGVIQLALQIAALVDLRRRPGRKVKGTKAAWTAASFVNYLGPLAYFVFGRRRAAK